MDVPLLHEQRVARACYHVRDAIHGIPRLHPSDEPLPQTAYLLHLLLTPLLHPILLCYVSLTIFESPLWCLRAKQQFGLDLCNSPLYPSFPIPIVPFWLNLLFEVCALFMLILDLLLFNASQGARSHNFSQFLGNSRQRATALLLFLAFVDVAYAYTTPITWWRAAPYLRAALCGIYSPGIRQQVDVMRRAVPRFAGAGFLLAVFVLYCGYLLTTIFPPDSAEGAVLPTLWEAMWQLLLLLTTANFPDVMMPAYSSNRLSCLLFIAFVTIGVFFLMNYLLAVVYASYNEAHSEYRREALGHRARSLDTAFSLLDWDEQGFLTPDRIAAMLEQIPRTSGQTAVMRRLVSTIRSVFGHKASHSVPSGRWGTLSRQVLPSRLLAEEQAALHRALLFAVLDASGDSKIQREEFSNITHVLHLSFRRRDNRSLLQMLFPAADQSSAVQTLRILLGSKRFDLGVDCAVVASVLALAVEGPSTAAAAPLPSLGGGVLSVGQVLLTILFSIEFLLKATVATGAPNLLDSATRTNCPDSAPGLLCLIRPAWPIRPP